MRGQPFATCLIRSLSFKRSHVRKVDSGCFRGHDNGERSSACSANEFFFPLRLKCDVKHRLPRHDNAHDHWARADEQHSRTLRTNRKVTNAIFTVGSEELAAGIADASLSYSPFKTLVARVAGSVFSGISRIQDSQFG